MCVLLQAKAVWTRFPITPPSLSDPHCLPGCTWLPVRHCAAILTPPPTLTPTSHQAPQLVVVGGGAFCFSFGSVFSGAFATDLTPLMPTDLLMRPTPVSQGSSGAFGTDLTQPIPEGSIIRPTTFVPPSSRAASESSAAQQTSIAPRKQDSTQAPPAKQQLGMPAAPKSASCDGNNWVLRIPTVAAKAVKDALKGVGWLDTARKAGTEETVSLQLLSNTGHSNGVGSALPAGQLDSPAANGHQPQQPAAAANGGSCRWVLLPLKPAAVQPLQAVATAAAAAAAAAAGPVPTDPAHSNGNGSLAVSVPAVVVTAVQSGGAHLVACETGVNRKDPSAHAPLARMEAGVQALLAPNTPETVVRALINDLPTK